MGNIKLCPVPGCNAPVRSGRFVCWHCWELSSPAARERLLWAAHTYRCARRTPKAAVFALRRAMALRLLMDEVAQHWTRRPRTEHLLEAVRA